MHDRLFCDFWLLLAIASQTAEFLLDLVSGHVSGPQAGRRGDAAGCSWLQYAPKAQASPMSAFWAAAGSSHMPMCVERGTWQHEQGTRVTYTLGWELKCSGSLAKSSRWVPNAWARGAAQGC